MSAKKTSANAAFTAPVFNADLFAGKEAFESAMKAGQDAAQKGYEKAVSAAKEGLEAYVKAGNDAFKKYEEVVSFSKENVEALVKAGTIYAKAMQDYSKTLAGLTQAQIEESVGASKALFGAKTFKDAVELQASFAKTSFDKLVAESNKLQSLSAKVAEQVAEPINDRVNLAVEKFLKVA